MSKLSSRQFTDYGTALHDAGCARPVLMIDKARLDKNIDQIKRVIDRGFDFRIVAKSLPSTDMLRHIMEKTGTNRLMSFHLPFILEAVREFPNSDILLGKPMPVAAAGQFYDRIGDSAFDPATQLQWLIDSEDRLTQYEKLAEDRGLSLRVSLEIDVGLHRGGFVNARAFRRALEQIKASTHLQLAGLMGYEAHICKIPKLFGGPDRAFDQAKQDYGRFRHMVEDVFGKEAADTMIFNTGGSSTYPLYDKPGPATEISTASALVKPTDFDVFTLDSHEPAAFIAAPVLKKVETPEIPMAPGLSSWLRKFGLMGKQGCYIYGGNWLASPCYPAGAKRSSILGHSSNQEMYELPAGSDLAIDDFMYFRPSQSEAVFLQFGDIAVYDDGKITDWWPVFNPGHNQ